ADLSGEAIRVVPVNRLAVKRRLLADPPRNDRTDRRRLAVLEIIGALDRGDDRDFERQTLTLSDHPVFAEELDRLVVRPVNADLTVGHDAEAVLETDHGARVDAEEVGREIPEISAAERARETMRDPKGALVFRQPEGRGEADQREVGL